MGVSPEKQPPSAISNVSKSSAIKTPNKFNYL
jgi:hypothetical protein